MDLSQLPTLGVAGALVIAVGYLLTAHHRLFEAARADRTDYLSALAAREAEHTAALSTARTTHADDLSALRIRIAELERRLAELEKTLDAERKRRREAEDREATAARAR